MEHKPLISPRALWIAIVIAALTSYALIYQAVPWCAGMGFDRTTCEYITKILAVTLPFAAVIGICLFLLYQERKRWEKHRAEMDALNLSVQSNIERAQQLMNDVKQAKSPEEKARLLAEGRRWVAEQRAASQPPPEV